MGLRRGMAGQRVALGDAIPDGLALVWHRNGTRIAATSDRRARVVVGHVNLYHSYRVEIWFFSRSLICQPPVI